MRRILDGINAYIAVADVVRTSFGTRTRGGIDKLPFSYNEDTRKFTHDGQDLRFAAQLLVGMAKSGESPFGVYAAIAVILLAAELLKEAKPLIEDKGMHHHHIKHIYEQASTLAKKKINTLAVRLESESSEEKEKFLVKRASTALSSKLIGGEKEFLATMVVDAVLAIGNEDRLNMIGIKKVPGGTMRDSFLVNGIALEAPKRAEPQGPTFSYADFEHQPKKFLNPRILLLNIDLSPKLYTEYAEFWFSDAALNIINNLEECMNSGAKVVLSQGAIGPLAAMYFADHDIFYVDHVAEKDLHWVAAATGGTVQTNVNNILDEVLGSCDVFEEKQVGNEWFSVFAGCPSGRTATIVLRGGDELIEEAERSLHDAIVAVGRDLKISDVVAGGGAIEIEISIYLKQHARTLASTSQCMLNSYANALEVVPRQLCDNAGFDASDVVNKLRKKHALPSGEGGAYGVDMDSGGIGDSLANFMWEDAHVKIRIIEAATFAACLVLGLP